MAQRPTCLPGRLKQKPGTQRTPGHDDGGLGLQGGSPSTFQVHRAFHPATNTVSKSWTRAYKQISEKTPNPRLTKVKRGREGRSQKAKFRYNLKTNNRHPPAHSEDSLAGAQWPLTGWGGVTTGGAGVPASLCKLTVWPGLHLLGPNGVFPRSPSNRK